MRHQDRLKLTFERHLAETECLDRIEYVETKISKQDGPSYTGWIRVLTK